MKRVLLLLVTVSSLAVAGCGDSSTFDIAKVSGTVTLDGAPLDGATVIFLPKASRGDEAGPSSVGKTDVSGKFTLTAGTGEDGAVVGMHQVMITTVDDADNQAESGDNVYARANREKVPARFNSATTLTFEVPADGTDSADFALVSGTGGGTSP